MSYTSKLVLFGASLFALTAAHAGGGWDHNGGGWNITLSNDFSKATDIKRWEFTMPWHGYGKSTDYILQDGYLEIQMLETDKGGMALSPKFSVKGDIKITVDHYIHKAGSVYLGGIHIMDETADPKRYPTPLNGIYIKFQNSFYPPDYVCSDYDIPYVSDKSGCTPKTFQSSTVTSSSLYDRWITTVINYSPKSGGITIDYNNDGTLDFIGTVPTEARFIPTRVVFNGYGWFTGHFYRISKVTIEGTN